MPEMWDLIGKECLNSELVHSVRFHALVLMPNHFHMILTVPDADLGKVMHLFMSYVSQTSNRISGRSGHLFGGRYHWSLINTSRYFGHALKYVYRNPVRAGICGRVENYPYSTLQGLLGLNHLPFPLYFTEVGMELGLPSHEPSSQLTWLNTPVPREAEVLIQKGLKKTEFGVIKDRNTRQPVRILEQLV